MRHGLHIPGKESLNIKIHFYYEYYTHVFYVNSISYKGSGLTTSDTVVSYIKRYQMKYGENVYPSDYKIDLEIIYNKYNIFSRLFIYYF